MATFYTGYRPVLKGRNRNNMVHFWKDTKGTYSNWSLFSSDHVLDGFPDRHVEPGAGDFPHGLQMSRWYRGLVNLWPLDGAGGGTRIEGMRFRPLEFKGLTSQKVFKSTFGHAANRDVSYAYYDNYTFDGVVAAEQLKSPGHARRASGGPANFGAFDPHIHKGVDLAMESGFGQAVPAGYDNAYGRNRVNEHRGVTSSKALNIT